MPAAKVAVNAAIRPIIKLIPWTLASTEMATIGRRQAATVFEAELTRRTSQVPENMTRMEFWFISA